MNKIYKVLFLPLLVFSFLFLLMKIDFFPYFLEKVRISQYIYRLVYPSEESFSGLKTIGFDYIFLGLLFGLIFLLIGILIKDKYLKIGSFILVGVFICIIVLGIYLQFFSI